MNEKSPPDPTDGAPSGDLWSAIEHFRANTDLEALDIETLLDGVRDLSPGREPDCHCEEQGLTVHLDPLETQDAGRMAHTPVEVPVETDKKTPVETAERGGCRATATILMANEY